MTPPLKPKDDYCRNDVLAARAKIEAAVPGVRFDEFDYGFGLGVMYPGMPHAVIVFQPEKLNGQQCIRKNVDEVIHTLKAHRDGIEAAASS